MEQIFSVHYHNNSWGSNESVSGTGSTYAQTAHIRDYIIFLIQKYNIQSVFDVPCGDFNWFKHIVQHIPKYIGGDIVPTLIENNNQKYGDKTFIKFNIISDAIPEDIDLIFCRDLLVHFSYDDIIKALKNIKNSNVKYLLTTTFMNRPFRDITTGDWRHVSFFNAPFNFPKPLSIINENCTEDYPVNIDKSLALWLVADIPNF